MQKTFLTLYEKCNNILKKVCKSIATDDIKYCIVKITFDKYIEIIYNKSLKEVVKGNVIVNKDIFQTYKKDFIIPAIKILRNYSSLIENWASIKKVDTDNLNYNDDVVIGHTEKFLENMEDHLKIIENIQLSQIHGTKKLKTRKATTHVLDNKEDDDENYSPDVQSLTSTSNTKKEDEDDEDDVYVDEFGTPAPPYNTPVSQKAGKSNIFLSKNRIRKLNNKKRYTKRKY